MTQWNFYTSNEIKPRGWLSRQLEIQAEGLSGHLDKIWPDVRDSAWIGGDREGWERVPYWLDGFIPLAYLLEDEDKIARAKRYIDAILCAQKEDGWICPCADEDRKTYDTWAVLLITKVLTVYYECSRDERIPTVIYRVLQNFYEGLRDGKLRLTEWGKFRWFEGFVALNFLHKKYNEAWIQDLAALLKEQGVDYKELTSEWYRPLNRWRLQTHIVNLVMMLKSEAVSCDLLGEAYTDQAEYLREVLTQYNGTPVETFTGDECLSGLSPIQGTELCSVVEQMYSYEWLYAYTGDRKWVERLEVLAYNALPATVSDDMWTHQYVQMSNQIACEKFSDKSLFRTNNSEAHLFGLEPHFGCCTANFGQGWPKFALSAFLYRDDTVLSALMVPAELQDGNRRITVETNYPFENSVTYRVQAGSDFTFQIRIPSFAENLTVNGKPATGDMLTFEISAHSDTEICIRFETKPRLVSRPHGLRTVQCGSLVFSVPISYEKRMNEYEKDGVERKFPYCDYEYVPTSDWNYAYRAEELQRQFNGVNEVPFSSRKPPVTVRAKVKPIDWGFEDGYETVCAKIPQSTKAIGEEREIDLYPYGCAKLRMTELPKI